MAGDTGGSGFSVWWRGVEPCTVVLFGASGDLAKRKVIPAMYDLAIHNALGTHYVIVGFARTPMSRKTAFRTTLGEAAKSISEVGPIDPKRWKRGSHPNLYYSSRGLRQPRTVRAACQAPSRKLDSSKNIGGNPSFSTFPRRLKVYPDIVEQAWPRRDSLVPTSPKLLGAHHH